MVKRNSSVACMKNDAGPTARQPKYLNFFVCAMARAKSVAGRTRDFDVIIIGGRTFGSVVAEHLFIADATRSRRMLVLEAGPFALPEHAENMPFMGGAPAMWLPWANHPALNCAGLLFAVGGRSLTWGGRS